MGVAAIVTEPSALTGLPLSGLKESQGLSVSWTLGHLPWAQSSLRPTPTPFQPQYMGTVGHYGAAKKYRTLLKFVGGKIERRPSALIALHF